MAGGAGAAPSPWLWVLDPIDGTKSFITGGAAHAAGGRGTTAAHARPAAGEICAVVVDMNVPADDSADPGRRRFCTRVSLLLVLLVGEARPVYDTPVQAVAVDMLVLATGMMAVALRGLQGSRCTER